MAQPPEAFESPSRVERLFNRLFGALVAFGLGLPHNWQLQVRGRRSGRLYTTPVDVLTHENRRYLVAPRGDTQWVRNARAYGEVMLRKGKRREGFRLRAVPEAEKPPILKAYLERFRRTVGRFFPVPAGSPVAAFTSIAGRYPVFELLPRKAGTRDGRERPT